MSQPGLEKSHADDKEDRKTHMEITDRKAADIVTLSLSGKLDANSAKAFENKVLAQIESGERRIVIDLAQLDYVSSAGLRVIILASRRLSSANGKMVLCSLKDPVREMFDIAGFSSIFSTYGSHDDAIKALQA
jgi:anti-sigma B factor antagonist